MGDLARFVDAYCERTGPEFWAEPVNALTNLGFVLAAGYGLWVWKRTPGQDSFALVLILLVFAVGVGSFLFHTVATVWAMLADVIPIALFIHAYLILALRRYFGLGWLGTLAGFVSFLVASFALGALLPRQASGGTGAYLPALIAMFVVGAALRLSTERNRALLASGALAGLDGDLFRREAIERPGRAGSLILAAGCVFAASLMFRTLDKAVCPVFPLGTHFLWHILNAVVLAVLVWTAVVARPYPTGWRAAAQSQPSPSSKSQASSPPQA